MSGPKAGTAAVGGAGAAVVGLAALAAVAIPVGAVALAGYGVYKSSQAAARGIDNAMKEHEKHKGNMRAEVDREERPMKSLLDNGAARWQSEKQNLDSIWQKAQNELMKLRASEGTPQTKKEAEAAFKLAEELRNEAATLSAQFQSQQQRADGKFAEARRNSGSSQRTVRRIVNEGKTAGDQAVGAINQATESARLATIRYEETLLIIQNKGAEERKIELARQNAQSCITAAKNEFSAENVALIDEWLGEESKKMLGEYIGKAETEFQAKRYEQAALSAQESVAVYRNFYAEAVKLKQQFLNREIIADALIAALTDLKYDEPDVNYEPKEGTDNAMLGSLTIFAKSKGETGDMRLAVDMDGNIALDADVPEGKEGECHQMLTDLQTKVGDVLDFNITDWGRAKDYKPDSKGGIPKQRIQTQDQIKQRGV